MVFGPALGSYIMEIYNSTFVVLLASLIALLNVFFIVLAVPESLPYKQRSFNNCISWKKADPFVVSNNKKVICFITFNIYFIFV